MFTYDPARIAEVALFRVRLELADTDPARPQFDDEELLALIELHGQEGAVREAKEILATVLASTPDAKVGDVTYRFPAAAEALRKQAASSSPSIVAPYCGGLSRAEKAADAADEDLTQPSFRKDLHE